MVKATAQDVDIWTCMDIDSKDEPDLPVKPKEPTATEVKANSTLLTLTGEDLAKYRILYKEYKTRLAKYKEKDHGIIKIKELI